jgi:hypothetical protein
MHSTTGSERTTGLPEGYVAIPVSQAETGAALRICVLVRQTPDPVAGPLVLLRDLYDAKVYLGCVTDAAERVREWLEVWVQDTQGLEASLPAHRESISNLSLDARWLKEAESFRQLGSTGCLWTGWESAHPPPTMLNVSQSRPVYLADERGTAWALCCDDAVLQAHGLPPYSTSLSRYLHQPAAGANTLFAVVTPGAPATTATKPLADVIVGAGEHLAFNAQGGLMMALDFAPLAFEEYVELLRSNSWPGIAHGKKRIMPGGVYDALIDWEQSKQIEAHLFLGSHGKAGRFLETFHLKLQLLLEVLRQARAFTENHQVPFLNLAADSFRVSLKQVGTGLPLLWTAQCSLVKPSAAFALPVETSDFSYFIRARSAGTSIYLPEGLSEPLQGSGQVRIRKVLAPEQGRTVLEGTLIPQEMIKVSPHDLLWMRLPLTSGRVDLYGHLYAAESLAQGEIRFRTLAQRFPEATVAALRASEGISFARSPFEVVPLLSSPCDLYSLGVLAVRTLLVDEKNTLGVALDEILSMARELAAGHNPEVPLGTRIRAVLEREKRYAESLGPHHLSKEVLDPETALRLLPLEFWCDTLGLLVSLFPSQGPDSFCRDYGDAPALALETVFNKPLEILEALLVRSRSLIVIDWGYNREIHSAIRQVLQSA